MYTCTCTCTTCLAASHYRVCKRDFYIEFYNRDSMGGGGGRALKQDPDFGPCFSCCTGTYMYDILLIMNDLLDIFNI